MYHIVPNAACVGLTFSLRPASSFSGDKPPPSGPPRPLFSPLGGPNVCMCVYIFKRRRGYEVQISFRNTYDLKNKWQNSVLLQQLVNRKKLSHLSKWWVPLLLLTNHEVDWRENLTHHFEMVICVAKELKFVVHDHKRARKRNKQTWKKTHLPM